MNDNRNKTIGDLVEEFLDTMERVCISVPDAPVTVIKCEIRKDRFYILAVKGKPRVTWNPNPVAPQSHLNLNFSAGQFYYGYGDENSGPDMKAYWVDIPEAYRPWFKDSLKSIAEAEAAVPLPPVTSAVAFSQAEDIAPSVERNKELLPEGAGRHHSSTIINKMYRVVIENGVCTVTFTTDLRAYSATLERIQQTGRMVTAGVCPFVHIVAPENLKAIEDWVAAQIDTVDSTPTSCECDNTHQANDTVCRYCWSKGRRHWNDPEVD